MKRIIAMLLAAAMLNIGATLSDKETDKKEDHRKEAVSFVDSKELDAGIEEILKKIHADKQNVSVALEFTATGETYFYNADNWIYTASLCKLPVAMTFAHMLKTGEAEKDAMTISDSAALEKILAYSNYSWYSKICKRIYGSVESKEQRAQDLEYAAFDKSLLPKYYYSGRSYSARFFMGVIKELYSNSEEYPEVLDYMKTASPEKYFRGLIEKDYVVAQKYGSDQSVVHSAGIIYTECPILLVIMTDNQTDSSGNIIISNLAEYFASSAEEWSKTYLASVPEELQENSD